MFQEVLTSIASPLNIILIFVGVVIGIVFGAIPGLSNTSGMALMLPVTFAMEPTTAIIFLASIYVGGMSSACISAILLGVPGATSSIATVFDGYPMAKKGFAGRALGIAVFSSAIATFTSILIAMLLTKPVARIAILLGPWEMFSLCVCAIVLVVTISKGDIFSGLISACIGLILGMVGIAPVDGAHRFTFGIINLLGGIPILAVALGVFAIANLTQNYAKADTKVSDIDVKGMKGIGIPLREYFSHWKTILKSFGIGLWIGFLPGLGGALSNIVSYASAKSSSKHPEKFGTGCAEGIIASEISNNAAIGGAIIPTIALGIPGDSACAILLTGLMIQGIEAGPLLMDRTAGLVYVFFAALLLSNLVTFIIQLLGVRTFPYVLKAPSCFLYSAIFLTCVMGMFSSSRSIFSCGIMVAMGALGVFLSFSNMNTSSFILGFILGPMMEEYMRKGLTYSDSGYMMFLQRPVSAALLIIACLCLFIPFIKSAMQKRKERLGKVTERDILSKKAEEYEVPEE